MTIQIVIADDHSVVLDGLRALIALEPELEVEAYCRNGLEVIEAVSLHRPDVLLMDATMPHCGGLEAHQILREKGLRVPTVIFSATMDDETVIQCLTASVEGIVLKESAASVLIDAVRTVASGEQWIPPELAARAVEFMARNQTEERGDLTAREFDIVVRVAGGRQNKRVAADLGIAESTVKLHLHNAFTKLEVGNRVQLSLLARERGWI
jgi:DNA-binding NarL/FixJ family response regulator